MRKLGPTWEKNGRKMRGKWGGGGGMDEIPIFHGSIPPIFPEVEILPPVSFVKISSVHSAAEKWEFSPVTNPHRHGG